MRTIITRAAAVVALIAAACVDTQPLRAQSVKVVTVTVDSPTVALGNRTTAHVRVRLANGTYSSTRSVVWGTSKPTIALVSDKGVVSTVGIGATTVAAIVGGVKGEASVTVVAADVPPTPPPAPAPVPVASVSASLAQPTIVVGAATQATAVARDSSGDVLTNRTIGWTSTAPSIATVSATGVVTAVAQGTATIRATVEAKTADALVTVTAAPSPPATDTTTTVAPPALLTTTLASTPSPGRTLTVASGGNLQAALDSAVRGDNIVLACGATFRGNYVLPVKPNGTNWNTLKSACSMSAEGTRAAPTGSYSTLRSPNGQAALAVAAGATRWRVIGLELVADSTVGVNELLQLGDGQATANSQLPRNLVIDRSYLHGYASQWVHRCVNLNSDSTAIVDSYISGCHADIDAQAIIGFAGNGPYKIVNNYLEASTEIVAFGGADPRIPNLVPSDIEIRRNHITRPMSWKGGPWLVKNLIEFKNARRALIEGNVMENSWLAAQWYAVVLWSVNQQGSCTWCITSDVLIQKNLIRNVAAVGQLTDKYRDTPSPPLQRVTIRNNVVIGLASAEAGDGGYGLLVSNLPKNVTIDHNTWFSPASPSLTLAAGFAAPDFRFTNNLTGGACGLYRTISMQGAFTAITTGASTMAGNVFACLDDYTHYIPAGNFFPMSLDAIGLAGGAGAAYSATATPDSLALTSGSAYHNAATDGTDIGADIAAVNAAIAGVVQSVPMGASRPRAAPAPAPTKPPTSTTATKPHTPEKPGPRSTIRIPVKKP